MAVSQRFGKKRELSPYQSLQQTKIVHRVIAQYHYYQELMKEGASNCVERHLNLNDCDTSLLWTYSQVGHKCCFHSQRNTPHASRLRYTARRTQAYVRVYIRRWRVAIVNCDSRSQRWSRKGKARSKGSESGKPRRHIGLQKDLGYSRRKLRSKTVSRPPKMTAQLGHFQLLTPRGNPKRVYSTGGSGQTIPWSALVGSH